MLTAVQLAELHSRCCHRGFASNCCLLQPANLMLGGIPHDSTDLSLGGELGVIKIADFGLSKSLAQNVQAANSRRGLDTAASGLNEEDDAWRGMR